MGSNLTLALKRTGLYIFLGLLAYMPLHILLSTWIGSSTNTLDLAKVAKDGVLVIGFLLTLGLSIRQPWFKPLLRDKLLWLILAYTVLTLLLAAVKPTDPDAEILGVVYNTRFLLFFLYGVLLAHLFPAKHLRFLAIRTVLASATVVVLFGVVQYLWLANDALIHLGYSRDNGVLPAFFIDEKPDLERAMSTLRDPNSLGSYLIIVASIVLSVLLAVKQRLRTAWLGFLLLATGLCLWFTFSRSAAIGLLLALGVFVALSDHKAKRALLRRKRSVLAITTIVLLIAAGSVYAARNTYLVQNVLLHADQNTVLEDPNQLRLRFIKESVNNIADHPEGTGPGTAGLASIRNDVQGVILNENYYLQIATETGLIGLLLFLAILGVVAKRLYDQRQALLPLALLASFVGLAFTNLLVHIWSNEAVAYTWWGLAGLVIVHTELAKNGGKTRGKRQLEKA